jgi:hypothetical protein
MIWNPHTESFLAISHKVILEKYISGPEPFCDGLPDNFSFE